MAPGQKVKTFVAVKKCFVKIRKKYNVMNQRIVKPAKKGIKYWWISLLTGILAIILGIWCILTPTATLTALTYVFIAAFFINGVIEIIFSISNRKILSDWGWKLAGGLVDIALGTVLLILPSTVITVILIYAVGLWLLFRSINTLAEIIDIRRLGIKGWGWLLAAVITIVVLSFLFLISPIVFKGAFVVTFISIAFFIYGIYKIYISFMLRSLYKDIKK